MNVRSLPVLVALLAGGAVTHAAPASAAELDTAARSAVVAAYTAEYGRVEPDIVWSGDAASCAPGTTAPAYQLSVLQRVNFYRSLAGLPAVGYDAALAAPAQAAAAYQSNAGALSHYINPGTPCYSELASEGSMRSNLALGVHGVRAIDLYMEDPGDNNKAVGHRAWILLPTLPSIATGDVAAGNGKSAANALYVVGTQAPAASPRAGFLAFPNPGFFPDALTPARWSFELPSAAGVSYQEASVSVSGPAGTFAPTIIHRADRLVFEPGIARSVTVDTRWTVTISGLSGAPASTYTYTVTQVDVPQAIRAGAFSGYDMSSCAAPGSRMGKPTFAGSYDAVSLVAGQGDTDNELFAVDAEGWLTTRGALPLERTSFSVRVRAQAESGFAGEGVFTVNVKDGRDASVVCPPQGVSLSSSRTGVSLTWTAPLVTRPGVRYHVYVAPGGGYCTTTATSCTVRGTFSDNAKVSLYARVDDRWSDPVDLTVAHGASAGASTGPDTEPSTGSIASPVLTRNKRYVLASLLTLPEGKLAVKVTGGCVLSKDRRHLRAAPRRTTCRLTLQSTRRVSGRVTSVTTTKLFRVR